MSRRSFARIAVALAASLPVIAFVAVAAGPQEKATPHTPPVEKSHPESKLPPSSPFAETDDPSAGQVQARIALDKMINAYDLRPHPAPAIPDDPPPHEGALIDVPYIVEPPDLLLVEVLEALPGRPISGERLIRADGTISLGFYGDVHVRGLTLPQVKLAIIKHLRQYLNDDTLGLMTIEESESPEKKPQTSPVPPPDLPDDKLNPFDQPDRGKSTSPSTKPRAGLEPRRIRDAASRAGVRARTIRPVRGARLPQDDGTKTSAEAGPTPIQIPLPAQGGVRITVEVPGQNPAILLPNRAVAAPEPPAMEAVGEESWRPIDPLLSQHVFVDVTAYNSKDYYVLGDVLMPGKLPHTGHETVLDAIQYAGGLIPTAEPRDIRLVRPGRNGKPSRVYKVDLEAIQDRGEVGRNYQIFPGDRLVVGRNEIVKKTVEIDRLQAPIHAIVSSIQQDATLLKSLNLLSPGQNDEVLNDLVNFWAKEISRKGELKLDEQKLREILLHRVRTAPREGPK